MTVFHPRAWATNWPAGARPYLTRELCQQAHPDLTDAEIEKTPYVGPDDGVVKDASELLSPSEPQAPVSSVSVPTPKKSNNKKSK